MKTPYTDIRIHDPNESGKTANRLIQILTSCCEADTLCRPIAIPSPNIIKNDNFPADSVHRK